MSKAEVLAKHTYYNLMHGKYPNKLNMGAAVAEAYGASWQLVRKDYQKSVHSAETGAQSSLKAALAAAGEVEDKLGEQAEKGKPQGPKQRHKCRRCARE